LKQISESMTQIDGTTRQSLAATVQAEQSARDLNKLGQNLRELISTNDSDGHAILETRPSAPNGAD